jgi:hypothetical protein
MGQPSRFNGFRALNLLAATTITTAAADVVTTPITDLIGMQVVMAEATFTYGSGGTSAKFWLQTSLDFGTTWFDIACWAFATTTASAIMSTRSFTAVAANYTPTDATLADNTIKDGLLGDRLRIKYTTVGTYATSTTIAITGLSKGGW